ncbi:MAG: hypothetical protein IPJ69_05185 [Deltaproteobacteria bacterium]|nr:MAG: hypothetical protein IPJ69_05185 [Deltaproteobacteria bacterium]
MLKKLTTIFLITCNFTLSLNNAGCVSPQKISLRESSFEKDRNYTFHLQDDKNFRTSGENLGKKDEAIIIKSPEGDRTLSPTEIKFITGESVGNQTWKGLRYGAGIGALAVGVPFTIAVAAGYRGSCEGSSEPSDCKAMDGLTFLAIPLFYGLGAITGGLLGLVIGSQIPKQPEVTIVPTLSYSGKSGTNAHMDLSFKF